LLDPGARAGVLGRRGSHVLWLVNFMVGSE
jgi:hypothetical protein